MYLIFARQESDYRKNFHTLYCFEFYDGRNEIVLKDENRIMGIGELFYHFKKNRRICFKIDHQV